MAVVDPAIIPPDEEARMRAVARYDILDSPPDGAFDRITALAARLFDVPIAIVSVVDHDRIWFKSHHGLDVPQIDRDPGLCASAILQDDPWIIEDAPRDPRALANPLVAGEFGLRFYAGVPLRTEDGHNLGTLCIIDRQPRALSDEETATLRDLASMVISELELRLASRRAIVEAHEREQLKDAVLGMLSHELRTPATTIFAAAQILGRDPAIQHDARARDLFADLAGESDRLVRLIEDLLVLSRIENGRLTVEPEPVLLQRVLPTVVAGSGRQWPGRRIEVEVPTGLAPVAADQLYLEQVIANLLSNAIKYSPAESVVTVTVEPAGEELELRVRDRGIGLGSADPEAIFGLLVRAPEAARYAGGAGIGLYVCRRLLAAMGGRIHAEPAEGGGTVFVVRLRAAD